MHIERTDFLQKSVLFSLVIVVAGVFIYFFSFLNSGYSPYYGDEFFYFKNAESFMTHSSLEAAFTYSGNGSKLFGIDPHGPAYPLLYGFISKGLGWYSLSIPIINFGVFLIAVAFLIFSRENDLKITLLQVLLVLGSPITLFYSITFLPELIHLSGGIFLYLSCKKYLNSGNINDFYSLIGLIVILGFFRNTWFFSLISLVILPSHLNSFKKSILGFSGILLPFLFQHFFHEQVPNTFSGLNEMISENRLSEAFQEVFFNLKRNIYFAFTYSEGWFYTLQKIWFAGTLLMAIFNFKKNKMVQFGVICLGILILFNLVLYKNYTWVDLRLFTPMLFFLNLDFFSRFKKKKGTYVLLAINLASFALIIPLQSTMIFFRLNPEVKEIPLKIVATLEKLEADYILLDSAILHDFALYQLPISTDENEMIRYILPYYSMSMKEAEFKLTVENDQLNVSPRKILPQ